MLPAPFSVPDPKRVRMIVDTDCKNEADDAFALVHHLLTPMFDVRGIIAAHFESEAHRYGRPHQTVHASHEEIRRILRLMVLPQEPPVAVGGRGADARRAYAGGFRGRAADHPGGYAGG